MIKLFFFLIGSIRRCEKEGEEIFILNILDNFCIYCFCKVGRIVIKLIIYFMLKDIYFIIYNILLLKKICYFFFFYIDLIY